MKFLIKSDYFFYVLSLTEMKKFIKDVKRDGGSLSLGYKKYFNNSKPLTLIVGDKRSDLTLEIV